MWMTIFANADGLAKQTIVARKMTAGE